LYRYLPNLAIRLIDAIEDLRREGILSKEETALWLPHNCYKELNHTLFVTISYFRLTITGEGETANQG
jgi:hypothetical protein